MYVQQYGVAEAPAHGGQPLFQRQMIGPMIFGDSALHLVPFERLFPKVADSRQAPGDQPQPSPYLCAWKQRERRRRVNHHPCIDFGFGAIEINHSPGLTRDKHAVACPNAGVNQQVGKTIFKPFEDILTDPGVVHNPCGIVTSCMRHGNY